MSQRTDVVLCPKCHKKLARLVHGINGSMFIDCDQCGSSVKINASKVRISIDAVPANLLRTFRSTHTNG